MLGSPKKNNIGSGAQRHVRKSRDHSNEGFEGSHTSKSKSYQFTLKQNNTTELLSISFAYFTTKIVPKSQQKPRACCLFCFFRIFYWASAFFKGESLPSWGLCNLRMSSKLFNLDNVQELCESSGIAKKISNLIIYKKVVNHELYRGRRRFVVLFWHLLGLLLGLYGLLLVQNG